MTAVIGGVVVVGVVIGVVVGGEGEFGRGCAIGEAGVLEKHKFSLFLSFHSEVSTVS